MNAEAEKYSRIEYERRFLVACRADWKKFVEPYSKTFEDKYFKDTRLRLRVLTDSDSRRQLIKLTKKFESDSPYFQMISTIILSPVEYQIVTTEGRAVSGGFVSEIANQIDVKQLQAGTYMIRLNLEHFVPRKFIVYH